MGITVTRIATTATTEVDMDSGIIFVVGYEVEPATTNWEPYQEGFAPRHTPAQGFVVSVSFKGDTQNIISKLSKETLAIIQDEIDFVAQEVAQ